MESDLLAALRRERLLAIVRADDAAGAEAAVIALVEGGIRLVEVSLTTPDAVGVVSRARDVLSRARLPGPPALFGLGTVRTEADATRAADLDLFAVTPALTAGAREAIRLSVPLLCGAWTPSEVLAAFELGADAIKLFPADQGGPSYVQALRDPLPDVPIVPVGGVRPDAARAYLAAGAVAVGVGSPLVGDGAQGGDLEALRQRVGLFLKVLRDGGADRQ